MTLTLKAAFGLLTIILLTSCGSMKRTTVKQSSDSTHVQQATAVNATQTNEVKKQVAEAADVASFGIVFNDADTSIFTQPIYFVVAGDTAMVSTGRKPVAITYTHAKSNKKTDSTATVNTAIKATQTSDKTQVKKASENTVVKRTSNSTWVLLGAGAFTAIVCGIWFLFYVKRKKEETV